jgi:hypothetical protein
MRLLAACSLVPLTFAATAHGAPALTPLKACYVSVTTGPDQFETEPVPVVGSGFAPGASINVAVDGVDVQQGVVADANGAISGTVAAPGIEEGERLFTVSATQADDLKQTVSTQAKVTNLTARLKPRKASPRRTVRFIGQGFTDPDAAVYAHYVRAGTIRARKTVRLAGAPTGDCGLFSVRRRQFPFKPKAGNWTIQIDQSPRLGADVPTVSIDIRVRRVRL